MFYKNIEAIKRANKRAGQFWFNRDTMIFFNCCIHGGVIKGKYFISSEQNKLDDPRLFTVRMINEKGEIETIGEFQQYKTEVEARATFK